MNRLPRWISARALLCILGGLLAALGLWLPGSAQAACARNPSHTVVVEINLGRLVVPQEAGVGDVLVRREFPIPGSVQAPLTCLQGESDTLEGVMTMPASSALGESVHQTNLQGIGIRLSQLGADGSIGDLTYPRSVRIDHATRFSGMYSLLGSRFVVEIIKTEPATGSGTLTPGDYSTYRLSSAPGNPLLVSRVSGEAITIVSPTCSIVGQRNQTVTLGSVPLSGFDGVGSTQGEVPFSLAMRCSGGAGQTGAFADVSISFAGNPAPGTSASQGVLKNDQAGGDAASGVGIQLLERRSGSDQPIPMGEQLHLARIAADRSDPPMMIALLARYYQTEPAVRAGTVHAITTYNVTYQ